MVRVVSEQSVIHQAFGSIKGGQGKASIQIFGLQIVVLFIPYRYQYTTTEGSLSTHHSTVFCRLESDRNTTGSTQWRIEEYRGWLSY